MSAVHEVGLAGSFTAMHVMPGVEGPEGTLHSHDYRIEVVVSARRLDERGMVRDLDALRVALVKTVAVVENQDLEVIRPSDVEAVTVEVLARWAHEQLSVHLAGNDATLSVRVWESSDAFGGYAAPLDTSS